MNPVFFSLFNMMGVYPAVYAALLVPGGRSAGGLPAWPFITGSFFLGAFALLPYMARAIRAPYARHARALRPPARDSLPLLRPAR